MKIVKKNSTEKCHFHSHEKSMYIAWACFHNENDNEKRDNKQCLLDTPAG